MITELFVYLHHKKPVNPYVLLFPECPIDCATCASGTSCAKCKNDDMWFDPTVNACVGKIT